MTCNIQISGWTTQALPLCGIVSSIWRYCLHRLQVEEGEVLFLYNKFVRVALIVLYCSELSWIDGKNVFIIATFFHKCRLCSYLYRSLFPLLIYLTCMALFPDSCIQPHHSKFSETESQWRWNGLLKQFVKHTLKLIIHSLIFHFWCFDCIMNFVMFSWSLCLNDKCCFGFRWSAYMLHRRDLFPWFLFLSQRGN